MAGRGMNMTVPAWMRSAGGAVPGASGSAPAPAPAVAAPAAPAPAPAPAPLPPQQQAPPASHPTPAALAAQMPPGGFVPQPRREPPRGAPFGAPPHGFGSPYGHHHHHHAPPFQPMMPPPGPGMLPPGAGMLPPPVPAVAAAVPPPALPPPPPPAHGWQTAKTPEGREYYFNTLSGKTQYEKPEELKTEAEKALPVCVWEAHVNAETGKTYYFHKDDKRSVWEEPPEYTEYKAKLAAATAAAAAAPAPAPVAAPVPGGRFGPGVPMPTPYSHHPGYMPPPGHVMPGMMPPHAAAYPYAYAGAYPAAVPSVAATADAAPAAAASAAAAAAAPRKEAPPAAPAVDYGTPAERVAVFKELLRDKGVTADMKWEVALKSIQRDPRFNALEAVGKRRQAFSEFQSSLGKEEKEARRRRIVEATAGFQELLRVRTDVVRGDASFKDVERVLANDPAWKAVEDAGERESLFEDHIKDLLHREREAHKREAEAAERAFLALLASRPEITVQSLWTDVKVLLADEEAYVALPRNQRLELYKEYILGLETDIRARQKAEEDKVRAAHAAVRGELARCLRDFVDRGWVTPSMHYEDVLERFVEAPLPAEGAGSAGADAPAAAPDAAFAAPGSSEVGAGAAPVPGTATSGPDAAALTTLRAAWARVSELPAGPSPKTLVLDAIDAARRLARGDWDLLADLVADGKVGWTLDTSVDAETSFDQWSSRLLALEATLGERRRGGRGSTPVADLFARRPWSARAIYASLCNRAREAAAVEERRLRRLRERFFDLLADYYYRSDHVGTAWEDAQYELRHRSAYLEAPPEARVKWFAEYMEKLKAKAEAKAAKLQQARSGSGEGSSSSSGGAGTKREREEGEDGEGGEPPAKRSKDE